MNKTVTVFLTLLLSLNLWAGAGDSAGGSGKPRIVLNSSWQDVRRDESFVVKAPSIFLNSGAKKTGLSVFDVCLNGTQIQSIDTKPIYYAYPGGNAGPSYQAIGEDYWTLSLAELPLPIEETASEQNPIRFEVPVYDAEAKVRWFERKPLIVKKPYEIPVCSEVRE